jgi:hypothetical protein
MATLFSRRRTEITIETDRVWIIRWERHTRGRCPECGREVDMVGLAEAAAITGVTEGMLRVSARPPGWHFAEGDSEVPLVCLESLRNSRKWGA